MPSKFVLLSNNSMRALGCVARGRRATTASGPQYCEYVHLGFIFSTLLMHGTQIAFRRISSSIFSQRLQLDDSIITEVSV
ncbi:hypothetical protein K1T71_008843 [Dendrolimus kikuchii]|uniref:Uncharacterized protein n=1 Tax=Dendrolimus kikuchii TaxID=765133 RepID=A0ACC1CVG7_9NEOP|nr:hypothetical protein K1T71_008843 [Dendrolimus kikuchii]